MSNSNTNTYSVTTQAGKTHTVEDTLTHAQAGRAILNSTRQQTPFGIDMAEKAVAGDLLSVKQTSWLHVLAGWAMAPAPSTRGEGGTLANVASLFSSAIGAGKKFPRVYLALPDGGKLVLKSNGKGRVNITDGGPYGANKFYGSVALDTGEFRPGRDCNDAVRTMLSALDADPAKIAKDYGLATGQCCFCNLHLTDRRSVHQGYGPICADKHGLPWGEVPVKA